MNKEINISSDNLIEGKNVFFEILNSDYSIKKLFIQNGIKDNRLNNIIDDLKKKSCVVKFLPKDELDKISTTKKHQGIIALIEEYKYYEVDDILNYANEKNENPFIIICDEIEDPHNLGAIIRTANCVGAHGVIIKNRDACSVNATVIKASAGAAAYVKVAKVNNITKTIEELKKSGMWFYCADMDGDVMFDVNLKGKIGLVIGNEGKGVSRLVKEACDFVVKIPMKGNIDSLNASVACAVLSYEVLRQNL